MALRAGVGKRDITPPVGTPLAGRPRAYLSHSVHDSLWAKAIYIESGDTRALLISADLLLLERAFATGVREAISGYLRTPMEAVVLCTTHTHSGPGVGDWFPWEGREAYEEGLRRQIVEAAQEAQAAAAPASVFYASSRREGLSHNRRFVTRAGPVVTHPGSEDGALHPDGPVDPEIQAVLVTGEGDRPIAVLVGFACHPTAMGWKEGAISADYPCWIEREVKGGFGDRVEMLFFSGALGDVSDGGSPTVRLKTLGSGLAEKIGREVGREAVQALKERRVEVSSELVTAHTEARLPTIDMGPERRRWAGEVLKTPEGRPGWQVRDARMVLEMWRSWPGEIETGCPLVAVGELAFYGIPGELFCWYGLQLKAHSRFRHPFVLGLANDRIGYIADRVFPTKDIFDAPLNFEDRRLGERDDAGERLVRAALRLGNG
ncbi:MAG: hypothetical protein A3F84_00120 [Candidatus Handelsmanbacteria bacterium RIFCSPLOWO2_12_FULL_64_10]|uniref:Neutral/alkaline non-lysosomal ceramidase N-terminal domain-containing protein n=1 Tax=Handelsmanbacteria sp. (strain RIFCSPLOWO2_12_FULL_64_10) TaxID=1817868 RepID=A0A1F6CPH1_HANXR|nr:MAG: hypothetical protein A3F84_00120 [Candidatus Handelsmanbacteria bacterium RIFCSPLOWO2_12_FULL_64_10]